MKAIEIKNLRSLNDTGRIELKPITVLLGKNSAGKSTFLRTFPLLKQTVEVNTSEPVLWFGNYVDFGAYEDCLSKNTPEAPNNIEFDFSLTAPMNYSMNYIGMDIERPSKKIDINVLVSVEKRFVSRVVVKFLGQVIEVLMSENQTVNKVRINDNDFETKYAVWIPSDFIVPRIFHRERSEKRSPFSSFSDPFLEGCFEIVNEIDPKIEEQDLVRSLVMAYPFVTKEDLLNSIRKNKILKSLYDEFSNSKNALFDKFYNNFLAMKINDIFESCGRTISHEFKSVTYSKPLRADIQRYYRYQGLGISEIDPSGQNIPMFLSNLSANERKNFKDWTKQNLGIWFDIKTSEGHVSLIINEGDQSKQYNLADVGVGYSQILPIIVNLWRATKEYKMTSRSFIYYDDPENIDKMIAIEQPELHLHPAFQGKLIDIFSKFALSYETTHIKILFETHSETMLSRLGYLISKGKLDPGLVNVLLFDKDESGATKIRSSSFNSEGMLKEWPIDFFATERI